MNISVCKQFSLSVIACLLLACDGSGTNSPAPFGLDLDQTLSNTRTIAAVTPSQVTVSININGSPVANWQMSSGTDKVTLPLETYRDKSNTLLVTWVESVEGQEILLERYNGTFTVTENNQQVTPSGNHISSDSTGDFDFDGDGVSNLLERQNNTDPLMSNNTNPDSGNTGATSPDVPNLSLQFLSPKKHRLSWTAANNATFYKLLENKSGQSGFEVIVSDLSAGTTQFDQTVPLHQRSSAQYIVQACNTAACTNSDTVSVSGDQSAAVGYIKASNTRANDEFGTSVALSDDGLTMAVGAPQAGEGNQGAVYIYVFANGSWSQQGFFGDFGDSSGFGRDLALSGDGNTLVTSYRSEAASVVSVYIRNAATWQFQNSLQATNPGASDNFGASSYSTAANPLSLDFDGTTLAVGANAEQSNATGVNGDQSNNSLVAAGAVYLFERSGSEWIQTTYLKASNSQSLGLFGVSVSLSNDGNTLAVGASGNRDGNDSGSQHGAAYLYRKTGSSWQERSIFKSSRSGFYDEFGELVVLSGDGNHLAVVSQEFGAESSGGVGEVHLYSDTGGQWSLVNVYDPPNQRGSFFGASVDFSIDGKLLAIGQVGENSNARGINGDSTNNAANDAGAVHLYEQSVSQWLYKTYIKSSNTDSGDSFGRSLSLSANGDVIAVGAHSEDSSASGVSASQTDNSSESSGAVYLY